MSSKGFGEDAWAPYAARVTGTTRTCWWWGGSAGGNPHPTGLTPDEQYTHITLWSLLSAPLLLGCD